MDTHFFGLYDGHAGGRCSKFVSSSIADVLLDDPAYPSNLPQAIKRAYHSTNDQFLQLAERMKLHDGSTGITSIIRDGKLLVANVGDCRCVVLSGGKAIQMSVDQKPTSPDEQRRISALGGTVVYCMGTARVNGVLAVSRAFGNRTLKSVIRPDAELTMRELVKDDDFMVMASDGLWDVLRNADVCHIVYSCQSSQPPNGNAYGSISQLIAEELVHTALNRGSLDNVTCIVVKLNGPTGACPTLGGAGVGANGAASFGRGTTAPSTGHRGGISGGNSPTPNHNSIKEDQEDMGILASSTASVVDMLNAIMSSTSGLSSKGGAKKEVRSASTSKKGPMYNLSSGKPSEGMSSSMVDEALARAPPKLVNRSQSLKKLPDAYGAGDDSDNVTISGIESSNAKGIADYEAKEGNNGSLSRFMNNSFRLRAAGGGSMTPTGGIAATGTASPSQQVNTGYASLKRPMSVGSGSGMMPSIGQSSNSMPPANSRLFSASGSFANNTANNLEHTTSTMRGVNLPRNSPISTLFSGNNVH